MLSENQVIISLITFGYIIAKLMQKFLIKGHKQHHIQNYAKCKTFLLKMSVICIKRRGAIHGEVFEFYIIINSGIL